MFNEKQLEQLEDELDLKRVKSRDKGNITLSYLEGFDIIETANRVFGYGSWSYDIESLEHLSTEQNQNQNIVICYKAIVKVTVYDKDHIQNISRSDVGTGAGIAKTQSEAHEGATKEAVTDALKRALRSFGNQFGLSLYDKSKNHNNQSQTNNSNYNQVPNNNNQHYNQRANNSNNQYNASTQNTQQQAPYKHSQDFSQLINLGLAVIQQGDNLIVVGDNAFANKDVIKAHGFRWDTNNRQWYMNLRQVA
ncbi:Rad52/Rad22 family DNA repair protein [Halarcobacter bivalviorum]|uniref:Rad52/Rad22 family DNA repair protein n=1 Tax=Halarcobacter bivalviorum TaxID=663364 RepID=UPI00100BE060|nr:Rad52/Rad22 family DNA repair protein [Halarcobacter bivalviorum]RXK03335.1 DNA repair protein Rad52 [Halarcobacter bivalviorum]